MIDFDGDLEPGSPRRRDTCRSLFALAWHRHPLPDPKLSLGQIRGGDMASACYSIT